MLGGGGIQFQVCRNPYLKCALVERVNCTIRDRLYKYFTHKNTFPSSCQHEFRNVYCVPVEQRRFQDIRIEF